MLKGIYNKLASLNMGIALLVLIIVLMGIGSFLGSERTGINDMPLFIWMTEAPVTFSWWLWGTVVLLVILAINTLCCSVEAIRTRAGKVNLITLLAPQLMHVGCLLIVLAHLFSSVWGFKQVLQVGEGSTIGFPDGSRLQMARLEAQVGAMGMPTDFSGSIDHITASGRFRQDIRPNHPYFYKGFGVYLKDVEIYPTRVAMVEIHREPGAGPALAGGIIFTVANIMLLFVRRGNKLLPSASTSDSSPI